MEVIKKLIENYDNILAERRAKVILIQRDLDRTAKEYDQMFNLRGDFLKIMYLSCEHSFTGTWWNGRQIDDELKCIYCGKIKQEKDNQ